MNAAELRESEGLPPKIEDPGVLAQLYALQTSVMRSETGCLVPEAGATSIRSRTVRSTD